MTRELHGMQKLATARRMAKLKLPYLSTLMDRLAPVEVEGLGTFGITESLVLLIDPEVLEKWPLKKVAYVFSHEVFHPLNKHAERARRMKVLAPEASDWNLCADACINPTLRHVWDWNPGDDIMPSTLGQPDNLTVEERFALMRREQQPSGGGSGGKDEQAGEGSQRPQDGSGGSGDQQQGGPTSGTAQDEPGDWGGRCGSGAGNPLPGEPKPDHPAHRSPAQVAGAIRQAAEAIRQAEDKMAGSVPSDLLRVADAVLRPPEVPWQQKLLRAARRAVAWKAGAVDYRYDGVSRKQGGVGFGHGKPIMPRLRAPRVKTELWVDTSGSMDPRDLGIALSEGAAVLRAAGGEVRFMAIDTEVHTEREVRNVAEMRALLVGGGGTSFASAFAALRARRRHQRPAVVIFATDGDALGVPAAPPTDTNVIWLLVGKLARKPCSWGEHIFVK